MVIICGIAGFCFTPDSCINAKELAKVLLGKIEPRGREATGYAYMDAASGTIRTRNAPESATKFCASRDFAVDPASRSVILHTRLATQGTIHNPANNHPVLSYTPKGQTVAAVHNGCIWNDDALFAEHELTRFAQVDSEIVPAMIARFGSANYYTALPQIVGSVATAWLDERDPEWLFAARIWDSPLLVAHLDDARTHSGAVKVSGVIFASTVAALTASLTHLGLTWDSPGVKQYEIAEGEFLRVNAGVWDGLVYPFTLPDVISTPRVSSRASKAALTGRWDDEGDYDWRDPNYATNESSLMRLYGASDNGIGSGKVGTGKPAPKVNVGEGAGSDNCYGAMFGATCGVDYVCPSCDPDDDDAPAVLEDAASPSFWDRAEAENQRAQVISDLADRVSGDPAYCPDAAERAALRSLTDADLANIPEPVRVFLAESEDDYMMHMELCDGAECLWRDSLCPAVMGAAASDSDGVTGLPYVSDEVLAAAIERWGLSGATRAEELVVQN